MKKLIFFLLFTVSFYGQTYQNPTYGTVTEKSNSTDSAPAYFTTSQVDGVHKKTPAANIEKTANKSDSYTASSSTTYASTRALVDGLAVKSWIKSNESLALAQRKGDVLYGILDQYTGEEMTLSKIIVTPTVDNIIYFQLGSEYFKRDNINTLTVHNFGAKGDNIQDDTNSIQLMIDKLGYFKLLEGIYKITTSLLVRNISFYDTNFRGIDFERSVINCVGMSLVPAIKEESNTNAIRVNFYNFKINITSVARLF